jgi:hypothetical protein
MGDLFQFIIRCVEMPLFIFSVVGTIRFLKYKGIVEKGIVSDKPPLDYEKIRATCRISLMGATQFPTEGAS